MTLSAAALTCTHLLLTCARARARARARTCHHWSQIVTGRLFFYFDPVRRAPLVIKRFVGIKGGINTCKFQEPSGTNLGTKHFI